MNQEIKQIIIKVPNDVWEKLDALWRGKKIKSKTAFLKSCIENAEKVISVLEGK